MARESYDNDDIVRVLTDTRTIAMVGASPESDSSDANIASRRNVIVRGSNGVEPDSMRHFIDELKRRCVLRAALAYLAGSWLLVVASLLEPVKTGE